MFTNCLSLCSEKHTKCSDSDDVSTCKSCMVSCAKTFDGAMLECVQAQSDTTKLTYNASLDTCINTAGDVMDTCRTSCDDT